MSVVCWTEKMMLPMAIAVVVVAVVVVCAKFVFFSESVCGRLAYQSIKISSKSKVLSR